MKLKDAAFYNNFEVFANAILKRGKIMSSKFNEDEFFETEISDEDYKILEGIIFSSKISQKFAQNFETILSLILRLDPENPTRKLGWRSDEKIHSLSPETFEILLQPLFIQNVSNQVFYEIINLLLTDCLPEDLLDNFIQVLLAKNHLKSLKIFGDISNHKITKIDEDFIEFMLYDISFYYYNLYGLMNSAYKLEFWKWISLKEKKIAKNPAARFFETKAYFENIRENDPRTHVLNEVRRRRRQMMAFVKDSNGDFVKISQLYDWSEEFEKLNNEIFDFPKRFQRLKQGESNNHHMFFPSGMYDFPFPIHEYRNRKINQIQILKRAHEEMNKEIFEFAEKYGIPILTNDFLSVLRSYRRPYQDEYLNFLALMQAFCEICLAFEPSEDEIQENRVSKTFMLAARFYDLFNLQHKHITLKTIR